MTKRASNIFDLAKVCGVSISTVSRALNGRGDVSDDTRQFVTAKAKEIGYRPHPTARSLKLRRSDTLGVVVSSFRALQSPIPAEIFRGIGECAEKAGFRMLVVSLAREGDKDQSAVEALASHQVDGVLLFEPNPSDDLAEFENLGLPVVAVNAALPGVASILSANYEGARQAVRYLLELGHRGIGFMRGPSGNAAADQRYKGWMDGLHAAKIAPAKEWVVECPFTDYGLMSVDVEISAAESLLKQSELSAVLASSELMALGLYHATIAKGWVIPKDLSVLAFDDTWAGRSFQPALTCVRQNPYRMGQEAAQGLIEILKKSEKVAMEPRHSSVPVQLVIKSSCCPPKSQ